MKPKKQTNSLLYLACLRQLEKGYTLEMIDEYMMTNGIPEKQRNYVLKEIKKELLKRWRE